MTNDRDQKTLKKKDLMKKMRELIESMDEESQNISVFLKDYRAEHKLTQQDMAFILDVTERQYTYLERGEGTMVSRFNQLIKLLDLRPQPKD